MEIEIWSDIACPFCYIGKRKFEEAINEYNQPVNIIYKSYQLHPNVPQDSKELVVESLAKKFNISVEEAKQMNKHAVSLASEVGLKYKLDHIRNVNTSYAHQLSHLADKKGKMGEVVEKLFEAHFIKEKHINDLNVLKDIARSIGINEDEFDQTIFNKEISNKVANDQKEAELLGIQGVPFFLINKKYAVSGAQTKETFIEAFHKANKEHEKIENISLGDSCKIDEC